MEHETKFEFRFPGDITAEVVVRQDPKTGEVEVSVAFFDGWGHIVVVDDIHSVVGVPGVLEETQVKVSHN